MPKADLTLRHHDGVPWWEARLPRRWHFCREQTNGWDGITPISRCACGAIRIGLAGHWQNKNSRRKDKRRG